MDYPEATSSAGRAVYPPLPTEIFRKIFTIAVFVPTAKPATAFSISHVNRHWRAIALENAPMWSRILITPSNLSPQIVHHFLERSQPCPLVIELYDPRKDALVALDIDALEVIGALLVAHSERWKVWTTQIERWGFLEPLLRSRRDAGQKALPALTECSIICTYIRDIPLKTHYALDPCPALEYLTIPTPLPLSYPTSCTQLERLTFIGTDPYVHILNQYQHLQSLELFQPGGRRTGVGRGVVGHATLPNLNLKNAAIRILATEMYAYLEWDYMFRFFGDVSTPSLTTLIFMVVMPATPDSISPTSPNLVFPQSVTNLTLEASGEHLDVRSISVGLQVMLRGMPYVRRLTLGGLLGTDLLGAGLPGTDPLLPDTDYIDLSNEFTYLPELVRLISSNTSARSLHRLIDRRRENDLAAIRRLHIVRSDIPDAPDRAVLEERVERIAYFNKRPGITKRPRF